MGSLVWKILGIGGAVIAGLVANRAAEKLLSATGRDIRLDPKDPDTPLLDVILVILVTGTAAALGKALFARQMARFYRKSTGHLPTSIVRAREAREIA